MVKAAYAKKKKDAERRGDEATAIEVCFWICLNLFIFIVVRQ